MQTFRFFHLTNILNIFETKTLPLDAFLASYFRNHRALGSHDRKEICNTLYGIIRNRLLLQKLYPEAKSWEELIEKYLLYHWKDPKNIRHLPSYIQTSCPKFLFEKLVKHYGDEKAKKLALALNEKAPVTLRINPEKTTREQCIELLRSQGIPFVTKTSFSSLGLSLSENKGLFAIQAFKQGLFELQDEGSQIISSMVAAKPGDKVLDFCAGACGKTLGFAHKLQGKGQIYLYDIRPHALVEGKKRLARAGIQNYQVISKAQLFSSNFIEKMDWILLDVPCSGTGTLRRNPDAKWKISEKMIADLVSKQREIFKQAYPLLHPKGKLVYATCSLLHEENEAQMAYLLNNYPLKIVSNPFISFPSSGKMDGFFAAVFQKK